MTTVSSSGTSTTRAPPVSWHELFHNSPSRPHDRNRNRNRNRHRPSSPSSSNESLDDGFDSDHSEHLDPETGFDSFAVASRRARARAHSNSHPQPASSSSSASASASQQSLPATSSHALNSSSSTTATATATAHWAEADRFWSHVVDQAIFMPQNKPIDLSGKRITHILPTIADLSRFVAIAPPRYDTQHSQQTQIQIDSLSGPKSAGFGLVRHESYLAPFSSHRHNDATTLQSSAFARSKSSHNPFSRAPSASASASSPFARSHSAVSNFSSSSAWSTNSNSNSNSTPSQYHDPRDRQATLSIFLAQNSLTKLPSAMFQLSNLRVLSLRFNNLQHLPPAIGELQNLTELNIANNQLQYLPAEILRLRLELFTHFPNPWLRPPKDGRLTVRPILGIKAKHSRHIALHQLSTVDQTETPVRAQDFHQLELAPVEPPPLTRAGAPNAHSHSRSRTLDRTRSEAQVQGYLAQGIDRIGLSAGASIPEGPEGEGLDHELESDAIETESSVSAATASQNDSDERERILAAAFEDGASQDAASLEGQDAHQDSWIRSKVEGRSRYLGAKQVAGIGIPTLKELCVRRLLGPFDPAEGEVQGLVSPFLSPCISANRARRSSRSSCGSRIGTPTWGPQALRKGLSLSVRAISMSSSVGSESAARKRVPTLLEAYENGTLQSLVGELGHGLVRLLEAARRSATNDWGTRARMRRTNSSRKDPFARTASGIGKLPSATKDEQDQEEEEEEEGEEEQDVFGGVETAGSLDRGDDACENPWYSRCPNPRHLEEHVTGDPYGIQSSRPTYMLDRSRGMGSSSSVSSLGSTLGGAAAAAAAAAAAVAGTGAGESGNAASHGRFSPYSQASSTGTAATALGSGGHTSQPSEAAAPAAATVHHARFERGPSFSRTSSASSIVSRGARPGSTSLPYGRAHSTSFVRGFSTTSALSASGLRGGGGGDDAAPGAGRDWPLEEHEHRRARVFWQPAEQRIEWLSHVAGKRVGDAPSVEADLADQAAETTLNTRQSLDRLGLIPVMWRGCSHGCLDFLD